MRWIKRKVLQRDRLAFGEWHSETALLRAESDRWGKSDSDGGKECKRGRE